MYLNYSRAFQVGDGGGSIGLISTIDICLFQIYFYNFPHVMQLC